MQPLCFKRVKTPLFMQMETVDCGAAALGIILSYYGCHVPSRTLRTECLVSREGVSVSHLVKAAKRFGLDASVYQEGLLPAHTMPLILLWNPKHYVVLEGIQKDKVFINDPKYGPQIIQREALNKQFSGVAIQFLPNTSFKKQHKPKRWRTDLFPLVKEQRWPLVWLSLGMLCLSILNVSPLIFSKLFIDDMLRHDGLYTQSWLLSVMAGLFVLQLSISYCSRHLFRVLETRFAITLSTQLIKKLLSLPLIFFAHRRAGDLVYRIQAADRLAGTPWAAVCSLTTTLIQGMISLGVMFSYRPLLSGVALLGMLTYFFGVDYCQKKWAHVTSACRARLTELSVLTSNYLSMIAQIKAQCSEHVYLLKWQQRLDSYLVSHRQLSNKYQWIQLITLFIFSSGYLFILALGMYFVCQHQMTLGEMMACQILFLSFNEALIQRVKLGQQYGQIEMDLQSMADINDYPEKWEASPQKIKKKSAKGRIQLIDLTFGYSREFNPLFTHLNLTIEAGQQIAIMGPSGSGKSTLVHLLTGLYQPWSGEILIDDIPIADYSPMERSRLIGVVSQQQFFYQGSIKDNLCLWDESYSTTDIRNALQMACIDELLMHTEEGLDFQLLEGASNISGGQRQRLEIARTLLLKPPILILDEATSSLDLLIEEKIKQNLRAYPATKVVIAHRMRTIQDADSVWILKEGTLLEREPA